MSDNIQLASALNAKRSGLMTAEIFGGFSCDDDLQDAHLGKGDRNDDVNADDKNDSGGEDTCDLSGVNEPIENVDEYTADCYVTPSQNIRSLVSSVATQTTHVTDGSTQTDVVQPFTNPPVRNSLPHNATHAENFECDLLASVSPAHLNLSRSQLFALMNDIDHINDFDMRFDNRSS